MDTKGKRRKTKRTEISRSVEKSYLCILKSNKGKRRERERLELELTDRGCESGEALSLPEIDPSEFLSNRSAAFRYSKRNAERGRNPLHRAALVEILKRQLAVLPIVIERAQ